MVSRANKQPKIIYIKFGELVLKGKNRWDFIHCLFKNIKTSLKEFKKLEFKCQYDCIIISNFSNNKCQQIIDILKFIPGIALIIEACMLPRDLKKLHSFLKSHLSKIKQKTSFKVLTKRHDKRYAVNSMEFSQQLGHFVLENCKNLYVDIHQPQLKINVEILTNEFIVYFNKIVGLGGFPVGINGRVLLLLSGGIDSPVAAHLLMKKGFHVDFLTFASPPHTSSKLITKINKLIKTVTLNQKLEDSLLYVCKFTEIQHEIAHIIDHSYQITIMRRYFFRIAQDLAIKYHYDAIATGESLGQVASQTIESMNTISSVLNKEINVLRPLLIFDKNEIIAIAKKINTYETSILPYPDACSLFVPAHPTTKPNIKKAEFLEKKLFLINDLYKSVLDLKNKKLIIKSKFS